MTTIKELNAKCKKLGLTGYTKLNKADLIKFLLKHSKSKSTKDLVKSKPKFKIINKKKHKLSGAYIYKNKAQIDADIFIKDGFSVHILPMGNKWNLWTSSNYNVTKSKPLTWNEIKTQNLNRSKVKLNKTQKEITIFIFVAGKPLTFKDIEYSSNRTPQTVHKNLMGLIQLGYVSRYKKGNMFMYELTNMGKKAYHIFISDDKPLKTMDKKLRSALIKSFKELAKSSHEYSIALDFERHLKSPERFVAYRGGKVSTSRIGDFEIFGHTHPREQYVVPSIADIKGLEQNVPEFIIAGNSGDIYIFTLINKGKWNWWKRELNKRKIKQSHSGPIKGFLVDIKKNHPNFTYRQWYLTKPEGRKIFFEITGVKVIPYTKGMTIRMRDDPIKENKMLPKFSIRDLAEYHKS